MKWLHSKFVRLFWTAFVCVGWIAFARQAASADDGFEKLFAQSAQQGTTKRLRQVPSGAQGAERERSVSQIRFIEPARTKIALFSTDKKYTEIVTVPGHHNFERAETYRLKVSQITGRQGLTLYPTLQIYPAHPASADYLREQQLKIAISDDDLDYVESGGYLRKVLYLVDPKFRSLPIPGDDGLTTVVSTATTDMGTRLDPGVDPISEADRRGKILYVLRMGTIDMGIMEREMPMPLPEVRQAPAKNKPPVQFPAVAQLRFVGPIGMKVGWSPKAGNLGKAEITSPGRINFEMGKKYVLNLSEITGREGLKLNPSVTFFPLHPITEEFLNHQALTVELTDEDLDAVESGQLVTKVLYRPDPRYEELTIPGLENGTPTMSSTELDPGVDPVAEADRRGTIFCVLKIGNIRR